MACRRSFDDAKQAGVDGLIVVDLPPEEADELSVPAAAAGIDLIFLVAPTTDDAATATGARRMHAASSTTSRSPA